MYTQIFPDTGTVLKITRNVFGEVVAGNNRGIVVPVLFRENSSYREQQFMESIDCDSLFHTPNTSEFDVGDLFLHSGTYYRVVKVLPVNMPKYNVVQFFKIYLKRDRGIIS